MPFSVVIPAHDEEFVLGRCLDALLGGAQPGEVEIVVVANGCTDRTAEIARRYGDPVRVVETPVGSKTHALNLGDAAATRFPRLYVDADVVLPLASARRLAAALEMSPAASPSMDVDLSGSSWPVRAFYAVWTRLPYVREGMIGVGVYGVSAAGRARFGRFPDVVADDGYVRMHFAAEERPRVADAPVRVVAPAQLRDLIPVKTRSRLGGFEIARRFPELAARERSAKAYGGAASVVALRPWLWPQAIVYLWVNLRARALARRRLEAPSRVWERDLSSRRTATAPS